MREGNKNEIREMNKRREMDEKSDE